MSRKELSTDERNLIVQFILGDCVAGKPKRGRMKEASLKFGVSRQTVTRYWSAAKLQQQRGQAINIVSAKKNRKKPKVLEVNLNLLTSIELCKRGSIRLLAVALGVGTGTAHRWVTSGQIRSHTSPLRPDLTAPNKLLRMRFSLEHLELDVVLNRIKFKDMHNTVHIDEKWFYITKGTRKFYLAPEEEEPHRVCKSKTFITKIMFMCAVSRPLFAANGEVLFDGKIGIFPFTEMVPAKRNSKNRIRGTLEMKPIQSVTKQVIKACLINEILPAIRAKWPEGLSKEILIQQDNARPHISNDDCEFRAAASINGFNINLVQQPPNSPDTNVNDLGWFTSIQALQVTHACKNIEELLNAVIDSFNKLSPNTLNDVFLSLQGCLIEIMKIKGQNRYRIPHMGKGALRRTGCMPLNLEVPVQLAIESINYLKDMGSNEGLQQILDALQIEGSQ